MKVGEDGRYPQHSGRLQGEIIKFMQNISLILEDEAEKQAISVPNEVTN